MSINLVRKPVDGSLPFIDCDGAPFNQLAKVLARFLDVLKADEIAFNPIQLQQHIAIYGADFDLTSDREILPSQGILYQSGKPIAMIYHLAVPTIDPTEDTATIIEQRPSLAGRLIHEAETLESLAKSLRDRASRLS